MIDPFLESFNEYGSANKPTHHRNQTYVGGGGIANQ